MGFFISSGVRAQKYPHADRVCFRASPRVENHAQAIGSILLLRYPEGDFYWVPGWQTGWLTPGRRMRILFVAVSAVVLFFPIFWLFAQVVGNDWGAGIAALFMYVWYPYMALKFLGRKDAVPASDMESALAKGELAVKEYDVSAYIEIDEFEDEGLFFLLSIGPDETFCLRGQYLYEAVESGGFPASKIRVFWNRRLNSTYGVEGSGMQLMPLRMLPPLSEAQWDSGFLPGDRDIIAMGIEDVANRIEHDV